MKPRTFSLNLSGPGSGRLSDKDSLALEIFSVRFSLNTLRLGAEILDLILLTLFLTYLLRLEETAGEPLRSSVISVGYSEADMCVDSHLGAD